MRSLRTALVVGLVAFGVVISARVTLRAQDRVQPQVAADEPARGPGAPVPLVEALEQPFALPFGKPTRLDDVCLQLGRVLRAPVVLDRAALERQQLRPEDTVQLELEGVRLKTGLKLLLDQAGLTYKLIPEDNLLIVTDHQGSDDPLRRIFAELRTLHRDIHDMQDALDDLRAALGLDIEGELKIQKPTIIEEMPGGQEEKPDASEPKARPRSGM